MNNTGGIVFPPTSALYATSDYSGGWFIGTGLEVAVGGAGSGAARCAMRTTRRGR